VCPVKIDLHHELYAFRQELVQNNAIPLWKRSAMAVMTYVLARTWAYSLAGKLLRRTMPLLPRALVYGPWNPWGRQRELPPMPRQSFRDLVKEEPK
jgi:L-lactate dehydrogenase complex protein LldF